MADLDLNGRLGKIVDELVCQGVSLEQARREFERQFIIASLVASSGSLGRAAQKLGIHRNTLRNKVSSLSISTSELKRGSRP